MVADSNSHSQSPTPKRRVIQINAGKPLSFLEETGEPSSGALKESVVSKQVGETLKAYRDAAKELLAGKYQDLQPFAPGHLRGGCNITAVSCSDGLIVRYDLATEGPAKVRTGVVDASLMEFGPPISEFLVHFPKDPTSYDPGPNGPRLEMAKFSLTSDEVQPIATFRPLIFAPLSFPPGTTFPPPPHKPPLLVSVTNELEIVLGGRIAPADSDPTDPTTATHDFVARSKVKLQLGWQALEVFPPFDPQYWKPEYAPLWAETDLLASAARQQFSDAQFAALDPHVTARKTFQHLLQQFEGLLGGPEEPLHQFIKAHPQLLCPAHTKVWSKLPLGDRVTDFVFRQPANQYLLVELESPLRALFRKDGQQRQELTHAFNQILDWRSYIENDLAAVQNELGLTGISSNPDSLIVIGRSTSLSEENRRKLTTLQNQIPKLKIFTYEDLLAHAKAVAENLFGPLDITGDNLELYFSPA